MASKRKKALRLAKPFFRTPQGDLIRIEDAGMVAGSKRLRRVGILEEWLDRGVIDKAEFAAAERFATDYQRSRSLPRYATIDFERVAGNEDTGPEWLISRQRRAVEAVEAAQAAAGRRAAPLLVAIVGEGRPMRDVAAGGIQAATARATLCAALDLLATHYRLRHS